MLLTHWLRSVFAGRFCQPQSSRLRSRRRKVWEKWEVSVHPLGVAETLEDRTLLATFVVDIVDDENDGNFEPGDLSLREAVFLANTDGGSDNAEDDVIQFAPELAGMTITLSDTTDSDNGVPDLDINDATGTISIVGLGADQLTISGNGTSRIFEVFSEAVISGLTISNGRTSNGGGVLVNGANANLTLRDSVVSFNTATAGDGGGIRSTGTLTLISTTIHNNSADESGGGLAVSSGNATVLNSTFSGNQAGQSGGGIRSSATTTIINSTITGNTANVEGAFFREGGGVFAQGTETLVNSIVAGNSIKTSPTIMVQNDLDNSIETAFNNLIGDAASRGGITHGQDGNIVGNAGTGTIDINTVLDTALADNGGPTPTHPLVLGSPAINTGSNARATVDGQTTGTALATDQRGPGFDRILEGTVDIGAFEGTAPPIGSDLVLGSDDTFAVEINGNDPGTEFDQIVVTGAVALGDAMLLPSRLSTFVPAVGQQFIIVDNDGDDPVDGTFLNLADNDTFSIDSIIFRIDYDGGTGNDVVLTVVAPETVYVDDDFAALSPGDVPAAPAVVFGYDAFATIQEGVNQIATGGVVLVGDGLYNENIAIAKDLTLDGSGPQTVIDASGGNGITIDDGAGNLTIQDFRITGANIGVFDNSPSAIASLSLANLRIDASTEGGRIDGVASLDVTFTANADVVRIDSTAFDSTGLQSFAYANIAAFTLDGGDGSDTFHVAPISGTMLTINGNDPIAPASLGDVLNYGGPGVLLFDSLESGTIAEAGFDDVGFTGIEIISTDNVTGTNGNFTITAAADANDGDDDEFVLHRNVDDEIQIFLVDDPGDSMLVLSQSADAVNSLTFEGSSDDNRLTVDFSGGNPIPTGGVNYNGRGDGISDNDDLVIVNGIAETVTHTFANASNGSVGIQFTSGGPTSVIDYTGLEPITDAVIADHRVFNFADTSDLITLGDDAPNVPGLSRISSASTSETVDFANPAVSLTINAGGGDDTIALLALDSDPVLGFSANVIAGGGMGRDTFDLETATDIEPGTVNTYSLNGDDAADTFNISPTNADGPEIIINGNVPAASPGDTLNYNGAAAIIPNASTLGTGTLAPSISSDQQITFAEIETLNTANPPRLSIADASITEGSGGSTLLTFTVSLSNGFVEPVTVDVSTASGSAQAGSDFTSFHQTLTFTVPDANADNDFNVLTQTVSVAIHSDSVVEFDEEFFVNLSNANGAEILDSIAIGTIIDDDNAQFSIGDVTQTEAAGLFEFTVTLSNPVATPTTVRVDTLPTGFDPTVDAIPGTDFITLDDHSLTFAPDGSLTQTVTVQVVNDSIVELAETFQVALTDARFNGAADPLKVGIGDATALGTIANDDFATLSVNSVSQTEGDAGSTDMEFTGTLSKPAQIDVTATFTVTGSGLNPASADDIAGNAFPMGTVMILAGETTGTITIPVQGDLVVEPDETFTIALSDINLANVTAGPTATGTIQNDDINLAIAPLNAIRSEGNFGDTAFTFSVNRAGDLSRSTTVDFTVTGTTPNPANADDFGGVFPAGQVDFAPGQSMATLTILVQGDETVELDETFQVTLLPDPSFNITTGFATGTIDNDDTAAIAVSNVTQSEGGPDMTNFEFIVTLDKAVDAAVTLTASTVDATATATGNDYVAKVMSPISFGPNSPAGATQIVSVTVWGDAVVERDETFLVQLSDLATSGRSVQFAGGGGALNATGRILNDDSATISIDNDVTRSEADGDFEFVVRLSKSVGEIVTVDVNLALGSAGTSDLDIPAFAPATLVFDPNNDDDDDGDNNPLTERVTVSVIDDNLVELDETFLLRLEGETFAGQPADGRLTIDPNRSSAQGVIVNDDIASIRIVSDESAMESAGFIDFHVELTPPVDLEGSDFITVLVNTVSGTAQGGDVDFAAIASGTLTFSNDALDPNLDQDDNPLTRVVRVNLNAVDGIVERDETFQLQISNPTLNGLPAASRVTVDPAGSIRTGTIVDEDTATVTIDDVRETEGGDFEFTVTLEGLIGENVTLLAHTDAGTGTGPATATATSGVDFTAVADMPLAFTAGGPTVQTETITVHVGNDGLSEPIEDFLVRLSEIAFGGTAGFGRVTFAADPPNPNDPTPIPGQGRGIIEDASPPIRVSLLEDVSGREGDGPLSFTVVLLDHVGNPIAAQDHVTVRIATRMTGMTGSDAVPGADFEPLDSMLLTFSPGMSSISVEVPLISDEIVEPDESFEVFLTEPGIAGSSDNRVFLDSQSTAFGTIENDDTAALEIENASAAEGDTGTATLNFTVTLSAKVQGGVAIDFETILDPNPAANERAALFGEDLVHQSGRVVFNGSSANETQTIRITISGDTRTELDESFLVALLENTLAAQNPDAIAVLSAATGTIENDDSILVTGAGAGGGPHVRVINQLGEEISRAGLMAYFDVDPNFASGVRVAVGDINGDGTPDLITAPGPGSIGPRIRVFDGVNFSLMRDFMAYDPGFLGGLFVTTADLDGDGRDEIITAPDAGGGPHIRIFRFDDLGNRQDFAEFMAYDAGFLGGVRVATGDVDANGKPDLITGPGTGGGPHIKVFDLPTMQGGTAEVITGYNFMAFPGNFTGGVFVAAADFNRDGRADIAVGKGSESDRVRIFDGDDLSFTQIDVFPNDFSGGIRIATVERLGNNAPDLIAAAGPMRSPDIAIFEGSQIDVNEFDAADATIVSESLLDTAGDLGISESFQPYDPMFMGGVFVAGTVFPPSTGSPLRLAGNPNPNYVGESLSPTDLNFIASAAVERLERASLDSIIATELAGTAFIVRDLEPGLLGLATDDAVFIDDDATGLGWFIDPTPFADEEFAGFGLSASDSAALGRVDLLSVVLHELGHVLGLDDLEADEHGGDPMAESLAPGVRRLPGEEMLEAIFADGLLLEDLLTNSA